MKLFSFFRQELAIDLGTANTLIMQNDQIVVDEPSIVAINRKTNQTIAVGRRAMQMFEKTHEEIKTVRPLKDGVIADFQAAENMIEGFINMIDGRRRFFSHMKMVICIPSGITEVEKRAVFDSADHVDSKETYLIHEPMAAALGIGLDVEEPEGNMIIDIGGGTTEIAVIALSGIVCDQSIRIAGDELTGEEQANALSRALGRPIRYERLPIEALRSFSEEMATMYEWFERTGYTADVAEVHDFLRARLAGLRRQAHADGVADAFLQQDAQRRGAGHRALGGHAGLGQPQVQRVVGALRQRIEALPQIGANEGRREGDV